MPLICRRTISLPLENMPQVSSTVTAHNLRPLHAERAVCVSRHRAGDVVEVRGPAAAGLELVVRLVEGGVAGGAGVDAFFGRVLVVFAREGGFGAFFAENAKLFWWVLAGVEGRVGAATYLCLGRLATPGRSVYLGRPCWGLMIRMNRRGH
jgi:hypothetical protein